LFSDRNIDPCPNPIIRFRKYKPFEYITITAVLNHSERKNRNLLRKLNSRQALPGIKLNVPHRLKAMGEAELGTVLEDMENSFWLSVDQK
jgi:hypothetical protein